MSQAVCEGIVKSW